MHPKLFNIGPIPINTYGFLIALGFLTAVFVVQKLAAKSKLDSERILDFTFWLLLVGFLGARILYIITRMDYFVSDPMAVFRVWEGGLVFLGGPLACIPFGVWYMRKYKLPMWKTMDVLIPGLVINHAFGRMGCLAAGCCYGKPTGGSWGIKLYSELVERDLRGVPLHPTQIYEGVALLILFFGLLAIFKKKSFDGQVVLTYFMAYPVIRSVIEIFRGDLIRGFVIDDVLSTSQFLSVLIFIGASIVLVLRLRAVRSGEAQAHA
jgi:phosphatidylglycerol:prolipoprotein diacylglycerol transferase